MLQANIECGERRLEIEFSVRHLPREGITVVSTNYFGGRVPMILIARTNEEAGDRFSRKEGIRVCLQKLIWRITKEEWYLDFPGSLMSFDPDGVVHLRASSLEEVIIREKGTN